MYTYLYYVLHTFVSGISHKADVSDELMTDKLINILM